MNIGSFDVKIHRIFRFTDEKPLKAFVDICVNDALIIKGIKIIDGKQGLFVSMPQEQGKNKRWYENVRCVNKGIREYLEEIVLENYHSQNN